MYLHYMFQYYYIIKKHQISIQKKAYNYLTLLLFKQNRHSCYQKLFIKSKLLLNYEKDLMYALTHLNTLFRFFNNLKLMLKAFIKIKASNCKTVVKKVISTIEIMGKGLRKNLGQ